MRRFGANSSLKRLSLILRITSCEAHMKAAAAGAAATGASPLHVQVGGVVMIERELAEEAVLLAGDASRKIDGIGMAV